MSTGETIRESRIELADGLLEGGVRDGIFTHAAYAMAVRGQTVARGAFGLATLETVFDLASLTKPISTATLTMQLVERGALHLSRHIVKWFEPEYGPLPHLEEITVWHLITHTAGLAPIPRWPRPEQAADRVEMLRSTLYTPVARPPGMGYTYSDTGYILLGEILARVLGKPLSIAFSEEIAARLRLTHSGYRVPVSDHALVAPTGAGHAPGTVHDPRARDLGGVAGHAGLFGTVGDVMVFAECIRQGGSPLLSRASAARMATSQIDRSLGGQSLGWFCVGNDYLPRGDLFSDRSFGHSGFTGTLLLIDPEYDVSLALLTNRVANESQDGARFLNLRRLWLNVMAAAVV